MEPERLLTHTAHGRDRELAAALKGARAMPVCGKPVLVAFRNESGEMYRLARRLNRRDPCDDRLTIPDPRSPPL